MSKKILSSFFESAFRKTEVEVNPKDSNTISDDMLVIEKLLLQYGGSTYEDGLYRIHSLLSSNIWTQITEKCFPNYAGKIKCFSFDWYGRQYAQNIKEENLLYMFDVATFEDFELPTSIEYFHNNLLVETKYDTLLVDEYEDWKEKNPEPIKFNQCVGFKVPLFLGGAEDLDNLELQDMELYWEIQYKLYNG